MSKKNLLIIYAVLHVFNATLHGAAVAGGGDSTPVTRARAFASTLKLKIDPAAPLLQKRSDGTFCYETEVQRERKMRKSLVIFREDCKKRAAKHKKALIDAGIKSVVAAEARALGHAVCRPLSKCRTCFLREKALHLKVKETLSFLADAYAREEKRLEEVEATRELSRLLFGSVESDDAAAQAAYLGCIAQAQKFMNVVYEAGQKQFDQEAQDCRKKGLEHAADGVRDCECAKRHSSEELSEERTFDDGDIYMVGAVEMADAPMLSAEANETRALAGDVLSAARDLEKAVDADADFRTWAERHAITQFLEAVQKARKSDREVLLMFARARLTLIQTRYPQLCRRDDVKAAAAFIAEATKVSREAAR